MALQMASGRWFADHPTKLGRVVYFAGENPDDFGNKMIAACLHWDLDPERLPVTIVPGAFDMTDMIEEAERAAMTHTAHGPLSLIIPDTSSAFRFDGDENDNAGSLAWAQTLRRLTRLPGNPAVVVPTHPTKGAARDRLLPRGGGAYLNEVDGNLVLWSEPDSETTMLHWQGKLRGISFKPVYWFFAVWHG